MIRIGRDGLSVVVDIEHGLATDNSKAIRLSWECQSDITAAALGHVLRQEYERRVQAACQEAYDQGWKDAKAKTTRVRSWWRRWL